MAEPATTQRASTAGGEGALPRPALRRGEHSAAIVAAAHRLIVEKGDFTTQELIKEAGVALKTFYRHFSSKDQLLVFVLADLIESNTLALEEQARELPGPVERLELIVSTPLRVMDDRSRDFSPRFLTSEHWRLHQLFPDEVAAATRPFADLVERTLVAGQEAGVLAPRHPERDAWLITTTVMAVFHHYAFHPDDPARVSAAADLTAFCLAAVRADPAPASASRRARRSPSGRGRADK